MEEGGYNFEEYSTKSVYYVEFSFLDKGKYNEDFGYIIMREKERPSLLHSILFSNYYFWYDYDFILENVPDVDKVYSIIKTQM